MPTSRESLRGLLSRATTIKAATLLASFVLLFGLPSYSHAARTFHSGFEMGDTIEWIDYRDNTNLVTSPVKTGSFALHLNSLANAVRPQNVGGSDIYARFSFRWAGVGPSQAKPIVSFVGYRGTAVAILRLDPSGNFEFVDRAGTLFAEIPAPPPNEWHDVSLHIVVNTSGGDLDANDVYEFRIDDGAISASTVAAGNVSLYGLTVGHSYLAGTAVPVYVDDFKVNTPAGALNNSWPAGGGIIRLAPRADSTDPAHQSWNGTFADVDETPHDADLTTATAPGPLAAETYQHAAATSTAGEFAEAGPAALVVVVKMGGSAPASTANDLIIRSSGTDFPLAKTFTTAYRGYLRIDELDPADNQPWTPAKLDQAEIGVRAGSFASESNIPTVTALNW
ncbi:MAG: hypothetical protein HYT40_03550, partial [Candidatus Sungbacteria bacterium]|nr:hypothetical protein [Candidatus Sungbacteria bacterium]